MHAHGGESDFGRQAMLAGLVLFTCKIKSTPIRRCPPFSAVKADLFPIIRHY